MILGERDGNRGDRLMLPCLSVVGADGGPSTAAGPAARNFLSTERFTWSRGGRATAYTCDGRLAYPHRQPIPAYTHTYTYIYLCIYG